jgi:hypothetical protein
LQHLHRRGLALRVQRQQFHRAEVVHVTAGELFSGRGGTGFAGPLAAPP